MGIYGFYRFLIQRYPNIRRRFDDPSSPKINNLFIDANHIIYIAFSLIKGQQKEPVYKEVINYIDCMIKLCKPSDLIYIAFDGPPPLAKIQRQRSTRFMDVTLNNDESRCKVSPGTEFTDELNTKIRKFIEECVNKKLWSAKKVIYSGFYEFGEGEHKMMNYIRSRKLNNEWNSNDVTVFYTNDADGIVLSLALHEPNVILLKEANQFTFKENFEIFEPRTSPGELSYNSFDLVYVGLIREYLMLEFGCDKSSLENIIDDYVILTLFLGNDYIPHFHYIDIRAGDFALIMKVYRETFVKSGENIMSNGQIVKSSFIKLITAINDALKEKFGNELEMSSKEVHEDTVENSIIQKNSKENIDNEYEKFNYEYLHSLYPDEDVDELAAKMSVSLLDIIYWNVEYYYRGIKTALINYKFSHSPPIYYLLKNIDYTPKIDLCDYRIPPFLQLLMILPQSCSKYLPDSYAKLFEDEKIKKLKPAKFEMYPNIHAASYLTIPILPELCIDDYIEVYKTVSDKDVERNRSECSILFTDGDFVCLDTDLYITTSVSNVLIDNIDIKYPTLNSLPFDYEFREIQVKVFGRLSNGTSCVLKPKNENPLFNSLEDVLPYILEGRKILIGYPFYVPAVIVGASTPTQKIVNNTITSSERAELSGLESALMGSRAIEVDDKNIVLSCRGSVIVSYSGKSSISNINTTVFASTVKPFLVEQKPTVHKTVESGKQVVIVSGQYAGSVGTVKSVTNKRVTVSVKTKVGFNRRDLISFDERQWTPLLSICRKVSLPFAIVKALCSSITFEGSTTNYSYSFFSPDMNTVIDNFCKIIDREIFIHDRNMAFKDYASIFSHIKKHYDSVKGETKRPFVSLPKTVLVRNQSDFDDKMMYLKEYLTDNSPATKSYMVPSSKISVAYDSLSYYENKIINEGIKVYDNEVTLDINEVIVPGGEVTFTNNEPMLFSRFVVISDDSAYPFGEAGVIVGYDEANHKVDVLFDRELPSSSYMNGKIKTKRGGSLYLIDIIVL